MVLASVLISFIPSRPVFPVPLTEDSIFAPLYSLASFVKNKVLIGAWVYFWVFYPVLLIYISIFVPAPTVLMIVAL